jgi:DNA-binding transcriptional regulator LsrR (DeoR family)
LTLHQAAVQMDEEAALAARAAWLHFAGGKTQGEVAELLGVQNTKAHRLIARARNEGLIRVFVEGPIAGCIALEESLKAQYRLSHCEVVPNIDDGELPLRTLGMAGARYIRNLIESERYGLIGIGASPFDVIHRLAERTGAEAYVMPVPFFANTAEDRRVLESQYGVSDVIAMTREAELYIAGIGEVDRKSFIGSAGMLDEEDIDEVMKIGACAEILGHFFDEEGTRLANSVSDRAMAPHFDDLKTHKIVALAGGTSKTQAVRAILANGLLFGLITDEATARRLVTAKPGREPGKKNGKSAPG